MDRSAEVVGAVTAGPVKRVVPWLMLMGLMVFVFTIYGNYVRAARESAVQKPKLPAMKETTATAKPASRKKASPKTAVKRPDSKGTVVVNINGLNFRSAPDRGAGVLDVLEEGEELDYLAIQGSWVQVFNGSVTGWVSSKYVTIKE